MIPALRSAVCAMLCLCFACAGTLPVQAAAEQQRALLTIHVNTVAKSEVTVVLAGSDVLVRRADLEDAGLRGFAFVGNGKPEDWISLEGLAPALTFHVDDTNLVLDITVTPEHFGGLSIVDAQAHDRFELSKPAHSTFLNYGAGVYTRGGAAFTAQTGTRVGAGVLTAMVTQASRQSYQQNVAAWTIDEPATSKRVIVGDFFTNTGDLGSSVSFAGIGSSRYWGFNTGIVRSVLPGITGATETPATASIYINGTLYKQEALPPGQFNLQNLPVQNGASNVRVVVTDAFGRQQTYSSSFYASDALLAPGLTDFSYGFGAIRSQFGEAPVTGTGFAGRYAAGVSSDFTAGGRLEFAGRVFSGGPTFALRLPGGVLGIAAALSDDAGKSGSAALGSYEYMANRFSIGASYRMESAQYATLSAPAAADRPLGTATLNFGLPLTSRTSFGLAYVAQRFRDSGMQTQLQLSQWKTLSRSATLEVSETLSSYAGTRHAGFSTQVNFTSPGGDSASFGTSSSDGRTGVTANVDRPLGTQQNALGYDAGATLAPGDASIFAQAQYRWPFGDYLANISMNGGEKDVSFNAAGGLVFIGGKVFATRAVTDSYALVDAGMPGVRIQANNVDIGRTDRRGYLLVPQLESYFPNQIAINPADAPVNTQIDATAQRVVPMGQSGSIVTFDLRPVRTITGRLRVRLGNGALTVPAYGIFELLAANQKRVSDIGDDGEFYFENVPAGSYRGTIRYHGGTCLMQVTVPDADAPFLKIGTLFCSQRTIQ